MSEPLEDIATVDAPLLCNHLLVQLRLGLQTRNQLFGVASWWGTCPGLRAIVGRCRYKRLQHSRVLGCPSGG